MDPVTQAGVRRVSYDRLTAVTAAILGKLGMSEEDATMCAEAMVWSDLRGSPRHGVRNRLPQLIDRVRAGGVNPRPRWNLVRESNATALLDAAAGWGQVAGTRGMRLAVSKARRTGVGVTIVRNVDIAAALGWYPTVAMRDGMVGMVIGHTNPVMAPWGGTTKLLGNQPFAIGAPAGRRFPILFDSVVAAMSGNGMEAAHERGEQLPEGIAVNERGEPTVDPIEALAGRVLPMGGHRGYGLALMWEVLTGVMSGGRMAPELGGNPLGVNLFCLAMDPSFAMPYEDFVARIDELVDRIHASPPAPGVERVRVPGERGYECALQYERDGIPFTDGDLRQIRELADEFGVVW